MNANRILTQAESIRNNWGDAAAQRYLSRYQQQPMTRNLINGDRLISNDRHQPRLFSDLAAALLEVKAQAGGTCRSLAREYGCSQGTISSIRRRRGTYRKKPSSSD